MAKTIALEKLPWWERVIAKTSESDASKVKLFGDKVVRTWERKIKTKKTEIENMKSKLVDILLDEREKLNDIVEEYQSAFLTVDTKKISTTEGRNGYVETFTNNIVCKKGKVEAQEQYIKDVESSYAENIQEIEEEIKLLETFLATL